jgi:ferredoxin-NADP reductase
MEYTVRIIAITNVTHNVKRFVIEKPQGFHFTPGQATDLSINEEDWKDNKHPFTFTCLTDDPYLEFTIKIYPERNGITKRLGEMEAGAELIISDAWGAIEYKGPGYFIAGGAGITPFIAILRYLHKMNILEGNTLYFSNLTDEDIILEDELKAILGDNAHFTVTKQKDSKNDHRRIDADFLKAEIKDFKKHFYLCGPDQMVADLTKELEKVGAKADSVVFEK